MNGLAICCCKDFFRGDEDRDGLYNALEVDRSATQVEIKQAYKNMSLQIHPDKITQRGLEVTTVDKEKYQRMKESYDVLSNPQKRELYDQLGETGMNMMDDPVASVNVSSHTF
ncbi:unnamed protein product [Choristocarpus tenellus]